MKGELFMVVRVLFAAACIAMAGSVFAPPIAAAAPYKNCTEAKADGACNIPSSSDKYQSKLDRDGGDGLGCEC